MCVFNAYETHIKAHLPLMPCRKSANRRQYAIGCCGQHQPALRGHDGGGGGDGALFGVYVCA